MSVMMKCGHAANAKQASTGKPVCVICYGISPGATEIDPTPPSLQGRLAECAYCNRTRESSTDLAFFEHTPEQGRDRYYCGCRGWD